MAYYKRSYSKSSNLSSKATAEAVLFGVRRQFTVYPSSRFANRCSATGRSISKGEPIAMYEDNGKKYYTCWPLPSGSEIAKADPFADFRPTRYNLAIVNAIRNTDSHILISAAAGSGKTTASTWAIRECLSSLGKVAFMAFGSEDAIRLKEKLPSGVECSTTHSMGAGVLRSRFKSNGKYNKTKLLDLIAATCPADDNKLIDSVKDLVGKCKADAIRPGDKAGIALVATTYKIEIEDGKQQKAFECCDKCLELSLDVKTYGYDFDDMLWLPVVLNLPLPKYDFVGLDESQDFNECQLQLFARFVEDGSRIMAVGDANQALYLFRGARSDSFDRVRQMLNNTERGVTELDLPITWRNSLAVVNLARTIVGAVIEPRPNAPAGNVTFAKTIPSFLEEVSAGNMVLCRTNAALVMLAYRFINDGRAFHLKGGKQDAALLCWMISKQTNEFAKQDIADMLYNFDKFFESKKGEWSEYYFDTWYSRYEVIKLISNRCSSVKELLGEIKWLFNQPCNENSIILSTIHRAKGSEAETVYLINPQLLPHPKAATDEEKEQEKNAKYVAITRAKLDYHEVQGDIAKHFAACGDEGNESKHDHDFSDEDYESIEEEVCS